MLQLAVRALVSGVLIAIAAEVARRNPGWGGLVASLPLTTLIALTWLWHDTGDAVRAGDFVFGTVLYVVAALPALALLALLLKRGVGFAPSVAAATVMAMAGYLVMAWAGRRFGWPV